MTTFDWITLLLGLWTSILEWLAPLLDALGIVL